MIIPEVPAQFMWISAARAQHIRSRCSQAGIPLVLASLALGLMVFLFGRQLPTSYHQFNTGAIIAGEASVLCLFLSAISLAGSKPYVPGEYLNLTGARIARRVMGGMFGCSIAFTMLSWFILVMTVTSGPRQVDFAVGIVMYLLLLAMPSVLAAVAFSVGRKLFKAPFYTGPPPVTGWRPPGPVAG